MKKIFCVLAAVFVLLFAFTGCTGGNGDGAITADGEKASILVSYVAPENWETSSDYGIGMVVVTLKEAALISDIKVTQKDITTGADIEVSYKVICEWGTFGEEGYFFPASTRFFMYFKLYELPQRKAKYTIIINGTQQANFDDLTWAELDAMTLCRIDFTL